MNILIKSILEEERLKLANKIGNPIEIQLLADFFNSEKTLNDYVELVKKCNSNIEIVHTPLTGPGEDVEIDDFYDESKRNIFMETCRLASLIGEQQKKNIKVVVHCSMSFEKDIKNKDRMEVIDSTLVEALATYTNITIVIENVIPVIIGRNGFYGRNGFLNDNCLYVDYFIKKYGFRDRIGTVLDICHAITTIKILNYCCANIRLEDFFKFNKEHIKLIHLAQVGGNGYGEGNHGTGFYREDMRLLRKIVYLYNKYEYECDITIEVYEKDYFNPVALLNTRENLFDILSEE